MLTGVAAHDHAGPGVVLSYIFGAIAAMLTAFCYAGLNFNMSPPLLCIHVFHCLPGSEFAADYPLAGGAFNYIALTYGEFAAWVAACDLILEYTLSAVTRAVSPNGWIR